MSTYRTGNHHGITIVEQGGSRCLDEDHDCARGHLVAVVVDGGRELAERICAGLNRADAYDRALTDIEILLDEYRGAKALRAGVRAVVERLRGQGSHEDAPSARSLRPQDAEHGPGVPEVTLDDLSGSEGRTEIADSRERADVRRRIAERTEHRPSSLGGDGLGYGPCVGCGELWPCAQSRRECP